MDARAHFGGKKITLMGLGFLGRGAGDAAYLASCGAEILVTDLHSRWKLRAPLRSLREFPAIRYRLGRHVLADFTGQDMIIKGAGVPRNSPFVAYALQSGVPVRMSADLFAEHAGVPMIGVTGTRGKTTTTYLIKAVLDAAGAKTVLGGNIQGVSSLALLPEVSPQHVAVFELDVWQLAGFRSQGMSPHIAVFTTFYPDHLGFYDNDLGEYLHEKAHIFLNQKPGDVCIVGEQALPALADTYGSVVRRAVVTSERDIAGWELAMPGQHNRANAASARAACLAWGIDEAVIRPVIESFPGVPGRLELVRTINDVRIYNDTAAVIPQATCAGLEALGAPTILIMGGADKGNNTEDLVARARRLKHVVLLAGSGTDAIRRHLPDAPVYDTLKHALADAVAHAKPGDAILFSPAFSSRGMFRDAYDRGEQFNALVHSL